MLALREMLQKRMFYDHALVYPGVPEFSESLINMTFRASFGAGSDTDEVHVPAQLLLDVARLAEARGVQVAFRTQTVPIEDATERDGHLPPPTR